MRLFPSRKYKSGSGWCLWRWTVVDTGYIVRLHIIKSPWWALCLHWIVGPDPEPYLHDHPVSFLSIILYGWYCESRVIFKGPSWVSRGAAYRRRFNFIRASKSDRHTIKKVSKGGCLTLCFMGKKTREWGFHTGNEWVMWKDYYAAKRLAQ